MNVLALNEGSSSLKFGLFRVERSEIEILLMEEQHSMPADGEHAVTEVMRYLGKAGLPAPDAIGHRIVHGGPQLLEHCLLDDEVFSQLSKASAFAPLHTPLSISAIRQAQICFPGIPHVLCFDTTFHSTMPEFAKTLPLARELRDLGIRRYGFHGLSCESIVRQIGGAAPRRIVIAHLGNGGSVTALKDGQSIDTSMGFTPSGGIIMGTRCGDIDPGVIDYLIREEHYSAQMLDDMINRRSGLIGISGISSDMRRLHELADTNKDARLAVEMFCNSVRKAIAAMITVLDGIDLLIFTGGIGEHDAIVRSEICMGLSWMGVLLDADCNREQRELISASNSRCEVRLIESQETMQIARHSWAIISNANARNGC